MNKQLHNLNSLAGSLKLPNKYKGKSINYIIADAKSEYLKKRYKRLFASKLK